MDTCCWAPIKTTQGHKPAPEGQHIGVSRSISKAPSPVDVVEVERSVAGALLLARSLCTVVLVTRNFWQVYAVHAVDDLEVGQVGPACIAGSTLYIVGRLEGGNKETRVFWHAKGG